MSIPYENNVENLKIEVYDPKLDQTIYTIPHYNLVEYNMVWNSESLMNDGNIVFYDYENLLSIIPTMSYYKLIITIEDRVGYSSVQVFNIYDVQKSTYKQQVDIVSLFLMDEYSYGLSRLNYSKGYKQTDIKTIFEDAVSKIDIMNEKEIISSFDLQLDIIVPNSMNFIQWMEHIKHKYGFGIFVSKTNVYILDYKNMYLEAQPKDEFKFKFNHYQSNYPLKIFDLNVNLLNKYKSISNNPSLKIISVLPDNKQVLENIELIHYDKSVSEVKPNGVLTNRFDTVGFQSRVLIDEVTTKVPYYWDLLNNYKIDLTIKGVNELDLFTTISVEKMIPGSTEYDNMLSGKWLISRVSDKIQGLSYNQKVTLINPKLNEG